MGAELIWRELGATAGFSKPRPAEVLFERICRGNGISQLLTKPYSPTTTGKVERWH